MDSLYISTLSCNVKNIFLVKTYATVPVLFLFCTGILTICQLPYENKKRIQILKISFYINSKNFAFSIYLENISF